MFLLFRNISNRGAFVATVLCAGLSVAYYKLDQHERANPELLSKSGGAYTKPWSSRGGKSSSN